MNEINQMNSTLLNTETDGLRFQGLVVELGKVEKQ